jgi:2-succinyl-6-hydroxy-2,4-cyclohexadiene-1-carboxylate synthase
MIWALHGNLGSPSDWDGLEEACGLPVRAVDLYAARQPRDQVGAWLRELVKDDAEPVLLGYSMGGRLALGALVEDPSAWAAAVVVSAHAGLSDPLEREVRTGVDAVWAERIRVGEPGWENFLEAWDAQPVLGGKAGARCPGRRVWRESLVAGFEEWSLGRQPDFVHVFGGVEIPLLWVTGGDDLKFAREAERACAVLPAAEHLVVGGAGHRVPWEAPERFGAAVRTFAEKSGLL